MNRDTIKSILCLLLALIPFLFCGVFRNSSSLTETYRELVWVASIPGFLYFIRYQIVKPIVRDEVMKPLMKNMALCVRAIKGQEDALRKLQVLEALQD